jgi:hypothetical protein
MWLKFIAALVLLGTGLAQAGPAHAREVRIDHVTIAVQDLKRAAGGFTQAGFTIKPGRLHKNGLNNAHVKLSSGSYVELMSLTREPTGELSQTYADFLRTGAGGRVSGSVRPCYSGCGREAVKAGN